MLAPGRKQRHLVWSIHGIQNESDVTVNYFNKIIFILKLKLVLIILCINLTGNHVNTFYNP